VFSWSKKRLNSDFMSAVVENKTDCIRHLTKYYFGKQYRRYRKGKNRCPECGVKLEVNYEPER